MIAGADVFPAPASGSSRAARRELAGDTFSMNQYATWNRHEKHEKHEMAV
jgi:hypothetical protein